MGDLSPHFSRKEFACRCGCGKDDVHPLLVMALEDLREELGRPVVITSGVRCPEWNRAVGGRPNSAHLTGEAADIAVAGSAERMDLVRAALEVGFRRVGVAREFVHLDVSPTLPQDVLWVYGG